MARKREALTEIAEPAKTTLGITHLRRATLAEQILLDMLRASWGMRTSDAKEVFGTPEESAEFAVKAANALWNQVEKLSI